MGPAEHPAVLDGRGPASSSRHDVIDLQPHRGAAGPPVCEGPLALRLVPRHDLALHLGRHAGPSLRLFLEEGFQRGGQYLLVGGAWVSVRFTRLGHLQEGQELAGHRDVEAARGGGHRLDGRTLHLHLRRPEFTRVNFLVSICPGRSRFICSRYRVHWNEWLHLGDHRANRHDRTGLQFRRHLEGLQLRQTEEPRQDFRTVLLGDHRRQDCDGGEAEPPVPDRFQYFRKSLDEPGSGAAVVGGPAG